MEKVHAGVVPLGLAVACKWTGTLIEVNAGAFPKLSSTQLPPSLIRMTMAAAKDLAVVSFRTLKTRLMLKLPASWRPRGESMPDRRVLSIALLFHTMWLL